MQYESLCVISKSTVEARYNRLPAVPYTALHFAIGQVCCALSLLSTLHIARDVR